MNCPMCGGKAIAYMWFSPYRSRSCFCTQCDWSQSGSYDNIRMPIIFTKHYLVVYEKMWRDANIKNCRVLT